MPLSTNLLDLKQLDVEDQGAVAWDAGDSLGAVGETGRNGQTTLTADGQASNTDVPTLDDLTLPELKGEGRALLVGCVRTLAPLHVCVCWTR